MSPDESLGESPLEATPKTPLGLAELFTLDDSDIEELDKLLFFDWGGCT